MLHNLLIGLHTAAATVSFIAGSLVLRPRAGRPWFPVYFRIYQGALLAAVVFVIFAIGIDWESLALTPRVVYFGLALLAVYMLWRALKAGQCWQHQLPGWQAAYINHVGFNLTSLFEAFMIVFMIALSAPVWLVVAVSLLGVLAGSIVVRRIQAQANAESRHSD